MKFGPIRFEKLQTGTKRLLSECPKLAIRSVPLIKWPFTVAIKEKPTESSVKNHKDAENESKAEQFLVSSGPKQTDMA